jgi:hypothetical protein
MKEKLLKGIVYSSTKDRNDFKSGWIKKLIKKCYLDTVFNGNYKRKDELKDYWNVVIPTRKIADTGYCAVLKKMFRATDIIKIVSSNLTKYEEELNTMQVKEIG